jgi:hypothetical protein
MQMVVLDETVLGTSYSATTVAGTQRERRFRRLCYRKRFDLALFLRGWLALFLRRESTVFVPSYKFSRLVPSTVKGLESAATRAKILRALHNLHVECYRTCAARLRGPKDCETDVHSRRSKVCDHSWRGYCSTWRHIQRAVLLWDTGRPVALRICLQARTVHCRECRLLHQTSGERSGCSSTHCRRGVCWVPAWAISGSSSQFLSRK